MRLVIRNFYKFSQGSDIQADIGAGWCAGVTGVVQGLMSVDAEEARANLTCGDIFGQASTLLGNINQLKSDVKGLQALLGKQQHGENVCRLIHTEAFNGRSCKVGLGIVGWIPVAGYVSYLWNSTWRRNHVGCLFRLGRELLFFDPNYGLGHFDIRSNDALTIGDLDGALSTLMWKAGYLSYLASNTKVITVLDQGPLKLRQSFEDARKLERLTTLSKSFYRP